MKRIKRFRDILLYLLFVLCGVSYHPIIVRMSHVAGFERGTILSRYIMLLFAVVFLLSINLSLFKRSGFIRSVVFLLAIIFVFALIVASVFGNKGMIGDFRTLLFVLGVIMIGFDLQLDKKKFITLILAFCVPVLYSGLMQVLMNIGGFQILDQYLTDSKNSLGAMLASTCFAFFFLSLNSENKIWRVVFLFLALFSLVIVITIRARAAMLAVVAVSVFYYYLLKRNRNIIITVALLPIVVFFASLLLPDSVVDFVSASFTAGSQGEDISSGRFETYRQALDYLSFHPFLGNVRKLNQISWVHNYLLLKLYSFGILFSWPIIILYFTFLIHLIVTPFRLSPRSIKIFGYVCLLIMSVISLAEPTFPFSPGTVTLFSFVFLGASINSDERQEYETLSLKKMS